MVQPSQSCPGPMTRRQFIRLGAFSLAGFGMNGLLPLKLTGQPSSDDPDTAVILIWMPGGPPHMETYDPKPDAPEEYRGAFRPIRTVVPGLDVCEHLPMHARVADRFTLIRSISHHYNDHDGGHKYFLTGRDPSSPVGFVNEHPMVGSIVSRMRERVRRGVPNYIAGTEPSRAAIDTYSFGSAYLGVATHPFMVTGDPSSPGFRVRNLGPAGITTDRLNDRLQLLQSLDRMPTDLDRSGNMQAIGTFRQRSLELITADSAQQAFDLSREPQRLRERYGMHCWGQRALLARRLVEHGASFVTMVFENPYQSGVQYNSNGTYNWDSHAVNCHIFEDLLVRLPIFDRAVSALIEDIYDRGLDRKVLLIVTGEFGRTPRITYANNRPGRDHWPQAMSLLISGGGLRMGQVIGATNSRGEYPVQQLLRAGDLWATMYRHLGIDYENTTFLDNLGRPMPILPEGRPIPWL